MNALNNIKPVKEEEFYVKFKISRNDLENLVNESKAIRKNRPRKYFYDSDLHAVERLQSIYDFLILGLKKLDPNYLTFTGIKVNKTTLNVMLELVIKDLQHTTSLRFAYAVYQLMKRNRERFTRFSKDLSVPDKYSVEEYFRERLSHYFKNE